ncbi:uncharacterized protein Z518_08286 [Rhinocladiella mackenziei CBS 650.93]|uniref:ADP-ribosylhydrolase ARH3 n=1 Tax=Rhinocladiella mackenziei CBS 650.93 TaxID=1442369 RepID=A0A0D2J0C7_9EURO|nr:uncharacterized protein Z518_08286 [Rhinocladiella mackenziei CBS 650.93]KIX02345.1 hypothetical protein Z518_08286 [Rhinocladiella mackenziei CBS 650.93]
MERSSLITPESIPLSLRIRGSLYGLAVCDALGGPVEFKKRGSFPRVTSMLPNDNFGIGPGYFTDDTSMALCLAHSLLDNNGHSNIADQVKKYIAWWQQGYMSSTGSCFDIGVSTRSSLTTWSNYMEQEYNHLRPDSVAAEEALLSIKKKITDVFSKEQYCGNGSLMRVLPAALTAQSEQEAVEVARESSIPTHPHLRCVHACMIYVALVYQALNGASKTELAVSLCESVNEPPNNISDTAIESVLKARFQGYRTITDWKSTSSKSIRSTGYVVDSLEASLWAFFKTNSFEEGVLLVVNLGDDADTVGAIYGGIAGAFYGSEAIPERWLEEMQRLDLLNDTVHKILTLREKTI